LIAAVQDILVQYAAQLPVSLRQVYYALVATGSIEKTELAYNRLGEHLVRARRARMIPMGSIRDDGAVVTPCSDLADLIDATDRLHDLAGHIELDLQHDQDARVYLWCETRGMVPQLARIGDDYNVVTISGGGFDSVTAKYEMSQRFLNDDLTVVLHVGDYDPSGVAMVTALAEDLEAFGANVLLTRIAITPAQAEELNLPSAPVKPSDNRRFDDDSTYQAEALPPDVLEAIVRESIEMRLDMKQVERMRTEQDSVRAALTGLLADK